MVPGSAGMALATLDYAEDTGKLDYEHTTFQHDMVSVSKSNKGHGCHSGGHFKGYWQFMMPTDVSHPSTKESKICIFSHSVTALC